MYPFSGDPDYSLQCLSSLPLSLEYVNADNFEGYSRQFRPMFPTLMEVENRRLTLKSTLNSLIDWRSLSRQELLP